MLRYLVFLLSLCSLCFSYVNVTQSPYNAPGDGSTDATNAIKAAILTGEDVYFPQGKYLISQTLTVSVGGQRIFGEGEFHAGGNVGTMLSLNSDGIIVDGLGFNANSLTPGVTYSILVNSNHCEIINCIFSGLVGNYIRSNGDDIQIRHNFFDGRGGRCVNAIHCESNGFTINWNKFEDVNGFNIQTLRANNGIISKNIISNPTYIMSMMAYEGDTDFEFKTPVEFDRFGVQLNNVAVGPSGLSGYYSYTQDDKFISISFNSGLQNGDVVKLIGWTTLEPVNINAGCENILVESNIIDGSGDSGIVWCSDYNQDYILKSDSADPDNWVAANFPINISARNNEIRNISASGINGCDGVVSGNYIVDTGMAWKSNYGQWSSGIFAHKFPYLYANSVFASYESVPTYKYFTNTQDLSEPLAGQYKQSLYPVEVTTFFESAPEISNTDLIDVGTEFSFDSTGGIRTFLSFDLASLTTSTINALNLVLTHNGTGSGSVTRVINLYAIDSAFDSDVSWASISEAYIGEPVAIAVSKGTQLQGTPIHFSSTQKLVDIANRAVGSNGKLNLLMAIDELEDFSINFDEHLSFYDNSYQDESFSPQLSINYIQNENLRVKNVTNSTAHNNIGLAVLKADKNDVIEIASDEIYFEKLEFYEALTVTTDEANKLDSMFTAIIDNQGWGTCVDFCNQLDGLVSLSGFTLRGGMPLNSIDTGGGISARHIEVDINACVLIDNVAVNGGGISQADGKISNCLIINNSADNGGGIYGGLSEIVNSTISGNLANISGGGLENCEGEITNNIIWNNIPDELYESATPNYSCILGYDGDGTGNIDTDPLFVDENNGDYRLRSQAGRLQSKDVFENILSDNFNIKLDSDYQNIGNFATQEGLSALNSWEDLNYDTQGGNANWTSRIRVLDEYVFIKTGHGEQGLWVLGQDDLVQYSNYHLSFDVVTGLENNPGWAFVKFNFNTATVGTSPDTGLLINGDDVQLFEDSQIVLQATVPSVQGDMHRISIVSKKGNLTIAVDGQDTWVRDWTTIGTGDSGIGVFAIYGQQDSRIGFDNFSYMAVREVPDNSSGQIDLDTESSRCIGTGSINTIPVVNLRTNIGYLGDTQYASLTTQGLSLLSDIDNSGRVDLFDFSIFSEEYSTVSSSTFSDISRDEIVNMNDLFLLADEWLDEATWN